MAKKPHWKPGELNSVSAYLIVSDARQALAFHGRASGAKTKDHIPATGW